MFDLIAKILVVLNFLDGVFSILYFEMGLMEEMNPLMDIFLQADPVLFMAVKLAMVFPLILLLEKFQDNKTARYGLYSVTAFYSIIVISHIVFGIGLLL